VYYNAFNLVPTAAAEHYPMEQQDVDAELLVGERRCARCGVLFTNMDAAGRMDCRMHPIPITYGDRGRHGCCGMPAAHSLSDTGIHFRNSSSRQLARCMALGCTPVDHVEASEMYFAPITGRLPRGVRPRGDTAVLIREFRIPPQLRVADVDDGSDGTGPRYVEKVVFAPPTGVCAS
jgi:hypothetical protein